MALSYHTEIQNFIHLVIKISINKWQCKLALKMDKNHFTQKPLLNCMLQLVS